MAITEWAKWIARHGHACGALIACAPFDHGRDPLVPSISSCLPLQTVCRFVRCSCAILLRDAGYALQGHALNRCGGKSPGRWDRRLANVGTSPAPAPKVYPLSSI